MFNEFLEVLKENHFVEKPVDAKTFVESPDYLGQPELSEIQYQIVEAMSQIYRKEDLVDLLYDRSDSLPLQFDTEYLKVVAAQESLETQQMSLRQQAFQ